MSKPKICPLRMLENAIEEIAAQSFFESPSTGCFTRCAWYDDNNECCALLSMANTMKGGRGDGEEVQPGDLIRRCAPPSPEGEGKDDGEGWDDRDEGRWE